MSMFQCPDYGTRISDQAKSCPYCGYISLDCNLPISVQETYEAVPTFGYDIEEWMPS